MEDYEYVANFFADQTVFVTGASGFLGGVLVEKLLRSCPDIKQVYLLMRPRKDVSAQDRFKELLQSPLFSLHDPEKVERRVTAVSGDVSLPGLGLCEADRSVLERSASVVFHCAATTNFNSSIRYAVNTNLIGTQRVLQLCHKMPHIRVILYMSTAYCNCTLRDVVAEEVYPISRDPEEVIKMVEEMSDAELLEARERILGGHPNAYTFSKQMAENLLRRRRNNIPIVIVRPSIVVGTYAEPVPGWLGGINNGSCAFVAGSSKGVVRVASAYPHLLADIVPCDLVCNLSIAATAKAYDHLSQLINKVLSERPVNAMETIEEDSQYLKEGRFRYTAESLRDVYTPPIGYERAKLLINLFKKEEPKEDEEIQPEVEVEEDQQPIKTDLMEHLFYCEKIGVAISRSEMICIAMSLDKLGTKEAISKYRFWGKIFGLFKNYYIAEVILTDEEYAKRKEEVIAAAEEELKKEEEALAEEDKEGGGDAKNEVETPTDTKTIEDRRGRGDADVDGEEELTVEGGGEGEEEEEKQEVKEPPVIPEPPKSVYKKPPEVPAEYPGEGTNKNVFYVCNEPGDEWIELPDVTPKQIVVARKIRKYFTGLLDYEVITYPPFPGLEANYLRAQIARISAGTHVSPLGFYGFNVGGDEEEEEIEEEEDEEGGLKSFQEDPRFAGVPLKDLMDSTLTFWVHHEPYILKQGRTTWWSPKEKKRGEEGDEEEEEVEEEEEEGDVVEPEVGPAILTPLSEDASIEGVPPWSTRSSSDLLPSLALGIIRSNLWPGAYAFAKGRKCDNVYIGWGHKRVALNYSPPGLNPIQLEYPLGPEIMEIDDPTPQQEEEWRIAHEEKKKAPEEEEGEEEEEEEDEGEED